MKCETCKNWCSKNVPMDRAPAGIGRCEATATLWESTEWKWGENGEPDCRVFRAEIKGGMAFCQDASDYKAELYTTPDFGCVMWVAKEEQQ